MMSVMPLESEFDVGYLRARWVAEWGWGKMEDQPSIDAKRTNLFFIDIEVVVGLQWA
jgi:hypothetical protein